MGFFTTQSDANGDAQLLVSNKWWYFLAVALPSTALMYVSVFGHQLGGARLDSKERHSTKEA